MIKNLLLSAAVAIAAPMAAAASSMDALQSDLYHVENIEWANEGYTPRAFWLPHLVPGSNKLWQSTSGTLEFSGDHATLKGSAANVKDAELTFDYHFSFTRRSDTLAGYCQFDGPKRDCAEYPKADPTSWDYFDFAGDGSFTGTGILHGLVWKVTDRATNKHPPQAGYSANALTYDTLGFSTWTWSHLLEGGGLDFTTNTKTYSMYANGTTKKGDINMDLIPAPLPAAGWMLIAGVAGLGAIARRRKTKQV